MVVSLSPQDFKNTLTRKKHKFYHAEQCLNKSLLHKCQNKGN